MPRRLTGQELLEDRVHLTADHLLRTETERVLALAAANLLPTDHRMDYEEELLLPASCFLLPASWPEVPQPIYVQTAKNHR